MKRTACPYLGLKEDPTTALNFPSPGNFCHHAKPISPVKGSYQEKYCLTADHTACPIYQAAKPLPLPAPAAAAAQGIQLSDRQKVALAVMPFALATIAALALAWYILADRLGKPNTNIPQTGGQPVNNGQQVLSIGASPTAAPGDPEILQASPLPTIHNCPLPNNWVTYNVNPTDSLYRLSVVYGVSLEQLQKANCMGDQTVILPGQVIYLPYIPTMTPISTSTPAPQAVLPTNTNPPVVVGQPTDTSQPKPNPTGTATNVPPTATQGPTNTSVVPTDTSVPTATPRPTTIATTPVPPTSTEPPPATATNPPPPTATNPPPPTATDVPPPTATNPPPPPATATNPPPPPPPATATNPPPPTSPPPATATNSPLPTSPPPATSTSPPPAPTLPPATATNPPAPASTSPPPAPTNPPATDTPVPA